MGFFDTVKKVTSSAVNILESVAVSADNTARNKAKKMSDEELKTYASRTGKSNKYIEEEIARRGI